MSDDNRNSDEDRRKNGEFKMLPRSWIVWILLICSVVLAMLLKGGMTPPGDALSQFQFLNLAESNQVVKATVKFSPQSPYMTEIVGMYIKEPRKEGDSATNKELPFRTKVHLTEKKWMALLSNPNFEAQEPNTMLLSVLWGVLPFVIVGALIWFFFIRQIKMAGKGALSFGKSKARMLAKEKNKTTFKDVAGVEEAKEEVSELVEFLKDPRSFKNLVDESPRVF